MLEDWTAALDSGRSVDCIYFDYQKAFDTVPHERLLYKLSQYGIDAKIISWIRSFLTGRKQRVFVNGSSSHWSDVISGIPQGSVLGPLLFVLYVNDIPNLLSEGTSILMFADDTKLYRQIKSDDDAKSLQEDVSKLENWSNKWQLQFHPTKCKTMRISSKDQAPNKYKLYNTDLDTTTAERDLGVIVDNKLNFNEHIAKQSKKANMVMGIIRRTFKHLDDKMFVKLFKALVRPHLEYAQAVWHPQHAKEINLIESVQRRATKQVPKMKDMSYQERLEKLKLPSLLYRRLRGDMIEVYKRTHGHYDQDIKCPLAFNKQTARVTRGHTFKLFFRRPRLDCRKHFFAYRVVQNWNSLPDSMVNAKSLFSFENKLDIAWHHLKYDFDSLLKYKDNISKIKPSQTGRNNDNVDLDI